jgi:hypothetical protein
MPLDERKGTTHQPVIAERQLVRADGSDADVVTIRIHQPELRHPDAIHPWFCGYAIFGLPGIPEFYGPDVPGPDEVWFGNGEDSFQALALAFADVRALVERVEQEFDVEYTWPARGDWGHMLPRWVTGYYGRQYERRLLDVMEAEETRMVEARFPNPYAWNDPRHPSQIVRRGLFRSLRAWRGGWDEVDGRPFVKSFLADLARLAPEQWSQVHARVVERERTLARAYRFLQDISDEDAAWRTASQSGEVTWARKAMIAAAEWRADAVVARIPGDALGVLPPDEWRGRLRELVVHVLMLYWNLTVAAHEGFTRRAGLMVLEPFGALLSPGSVPSWPDDEPDHAAEAEEQSEPPRWEPPPPELFALRRLHAIDDPSVTVEVSVYAPRSVPGPRGSEWRCECEIRCAPELASESDRTFHLDQPDSLGALIGVLAAVRYRLDKISERLGSELVPTPPSDVRGPGVPYHVPTMLGPKFDREMNATVLREFRAFIDREPEYMEALRKDLSEGEEEI